ncbi:hypothetical protein P152DRAFT_517650 [Eremomyces bilateralis CBS 781.70]|uniref:HMG box domain-containing protein n=1 Tax=Eremomyces bilateralis CBS 781.70 TaxID=1392243 RepID=A0A6G1FRE7_9PEZI|nr:uncharacterized protein P152DRAFT_517650 [Eremomyces bilateralis CBS 781.70]KAF1808290.1 hypothetical protein P152DRAFT_517650 [Eremomyces bilateralis CBS 781.70]
MSTAAIEPSLEDQPCAELSAKLASSNLAQYEGVLAKCGFDTWSSVLQIGETDLERLQSELSRRRKLQREFTSNPPDVPETQPASPDALLDSSKRRVSLESRGKPLVDPDRPNHQKSIKRRYRRHPKPDPNAPVRPKTGYVEFSDHIRSTHDISGLSFVEVAKYVGNLWRDLGREGRGEREDKAAAAMILYRARLGEYKKTKGYARYHEYLKAFCSEQSSLTGSSEKRCSTEQRKGGRQPLDTSMDGGGESESIGPGILDTTLESPLSGSGDESSRRSDLFLISAPTSPTLYMFDPNYRFTIAPAMDAARGLLEMAPEGIEYLDSVNLPQKPLTSQVITAFMGGTGAMFPIYAREEIAAMLSWAQDYKNPAMDKFLLINMLVIIAVGSCFDYSLTDAHFRQSAFYSCLKQLTQSEGMSDLHHMRLFLCLSLYCTMESPLTATQFSNTALQIGRLQISPRADFNHNTPNSIPNNEAHYWRSVFRTAVFIETWQGLALGRKSNVLESDLHFACHWTSSSCFIEQILQEEVSKIGLILAEKMEGLGPTGSSSDVYGTTLRARKQRLAAWHNELPCSVHLASLDHRNEALYSLIQRRSILNMHMFYFSTLIGINHQLLYTLAEYESSGDWSCSGCTLDEAYLGRDECESAAQQMTRVVLLQQARTAGGSQFWIIVYQTFVACAVLVHCATLRLLHRSAEGFHADMSSAQACVDFLSQCTPNVWFTARYLNTVRPLFEEVSAASKTAPWAWIPANQEAAQSIVAGSLAKEEADMPSVMDKYHLLRIAKDTLCNLLIETDGCLVDEAG